MYSAFTCYVTAALRVRALVMKTTLMAHLSLAPYKESVTIKCRFTLQCGVGRSFRPSGGSYAPGEVALVIMDTKDHPI